MKELIHLRQKDFDTEMSLASTCWLNGMINIITEIDNLIRSAKTVFVVLSQANNQKKEQSVGVWLK